MTKKKIRFYLRGGVFYACNSWRAPPFCSKFLSPVWIICSIFLGCTDCRPQKWDWRAGLCQWFSMWGWSWYFALSSSRCAGSMLLMFCIQFLSLMLCVPGLFFWIPLMSFLHKFRFGVGSWVVTVAWYMTLLALHWPGRVFLLLALLYLPMFRHNSQYFFWPNIWFLIFMSLIYHSF